MENTYKNNKSLACLWMQPHMADVGSADLAYYYHLAYNNILLYSNING